MTTHARRPRLGTPVDGDRDAEQPLIRGFMFAILQEADHPDQIRVDPGGRIMGLPPGMRCEYPVGTRVCVAYVIRDGNYEVERLTADRPRSVTG